MTKIYPVLLAGGSGTRLWPLLRKSYPKQFSKLIEESTQPMLSRINIGTGTDGTIRELAETVQDIVQFKGNLVFDSTKPDGTPRKLIDVSLLSTLGWKSHTSFQDGLLQSYEDFVQNYR